MIRLSVFRDRHGDDWRGYCGTGRIQFVGFICRFLSVLERDLKSLDENQPPNYKARTLTSEESESFPAPPFSWSDICWLFPSSSRSRLFASGSSRRPTIFALIFV